MSNNHPLLSVVIPSYNMEDYLDKNLGLLTASKYLDAIEIIIVNDGSKDRTLAIAQDYQQRFPQSVAVIDKKNGHYGSCLNVALKRAEGKYFRILDADDWLETDSLNKFIERLTGCDADLVVTLRVENKPDNHGNLQKEFIPIHDVEYGRIYDARSFSIKDHSDGVEFNMHSMTYKTSVLRQTGIQLPEGICYTDMLYCLIPLNSIRTLVMYDIYLYNYLIGRDGNSTNDEALKRNLSHLSIVLMRMFEYLDKQDRNSLTEAVFNNQKRYVDEALNMFLASIRMRQFVDADLYEQYIYPVLAYCRKYEVEHRLFHKYYNRYWYKKNTCFSLNFSLAFYKLTHPFKKRKS